VSAEREARDDPRRLHEVNARLQTIALGSAAGQLRSPRKARWREKNPGEEGRAWDGLRRRRCGSNENIVLGRGAA